MIEDYYTQMELPCSCGCGALRVAQDKENQAVLLSYIIPAWYAGAFSGWKKALSLIWHILTGKQYYFYEVIIDDNLTLRRFKDFVANIEEIHGNETDDTSKPV